MSEQDSICAVSTPPGEGGIGIIRISGGMATEIAVKIFKPRRDKNLLTAPSHSLHYGHVVDPASGETVDEALLSVMRAPSTYTREDVIEIHCHGGMMPPGEPWGCASQQARDRQNQASSRSGRF